MDTSHSGPGIHGSTCVSRLKDRQKRHEIFWNSAERRYEVYYHEPDPGKKPIFFWIPEHCVAWAEPLSE